MKNASVLAFCALFLPACSTVSPDIKRLAPVYTPGTPPPVCRLLSVTPGSAAAQAGIRPGDEILTVNKKQPEHAAALVDLINRAPEDSALEVRSGEERRTVRVRLAPTAPRLGAACDLTGWTKAGVSAAGNESLTLYDGPVSLTLSGIMDNAKSLVFLRVRVTHFGADPLWVGPSAFRVSEATGQAIPVLSPEQTMCYLYGGKGVDVFSRQSRKKSGDPDTAPPTEPPAEQKPCDGLPAVAKMGNATADYVEENAKYLAAESLVGRSLRNGEVADGLIYFPQPSSTPIVVKAVLGDKTFDMTFGMPQVAAVAMKEGDVSGFLEAQKKGAPLRVTLKSGKVFVGKFSSYDAIEEVLWFDTPSGSLLNTTSFPLRSVRSVEPVEKN